MTLEQKLRDPEQILTIAEFLALTPYDGQIARVWIDTATSLGDFDRVWTFRYRLTNPDGSSNGVTNKWDFLDGVPLYKAIEASVSFTPGGANDWSNTTDPGPDLKAPINGRYHVDFGANINAAADGDTNQVGVSNGSGNDPVTSAAISSANVNVQTCSRRSTMDIATNARLRLMYRDAHSSGTASWSHRWISLIPVRVG